MFTGIIEEIGIVKNIQKISGRLRFSIYTPKSLTKIKPGHSIAINGVCHTIIKKTKNTFQVDTIEETLKKTTLKFLKKGDEVNLERPLRFNEPLGGHLILGHVDTFGTIKKIETLEGSWTFDIKVQPQFRHNLIPRGSIAVDGVSLTIAEVLPDGFRVAIIPATMEKTIFKHYKIDSLVNLEFDVIGKYIERLMECYRYQVPKKKYSIKWLEEQGY